MTDFEYLIASTPNAVLTFDRDWVITFVNPEALRIGRGTEADYLGQVYWNLRPQLVGTDFEHRLRHAMQFREPARFDYFYPPFDIWIDFAVRLTPSGLALFYQDITARKTAENTRDLLTRQLQQVFDTTTDGVIGLDRDYNFTFLNRRAQQLLAVKGDLLGRNIWKEFPDALQEGSPFPVHYDRAMNQGIPGEFESFYPAPLNLWLSVQARPADNGIVLFFRDITEQRATRQGLLDQQTLLSFVQKTACVATWEIDLATGAMTFGPGSFPVFGHPFAEIQSVEHFHSLVAPSHLDRVQQAASNAVETGVMTTVDYPVIASHGATIWIEGRGIPAYDKQGAATHLRGMSTDITARKRNEEALAASEERYRVLTDLNPGAIWMGAPDGRITYANQGFLDYLGITLNDLGGLGWLNSFAEQDRPRVIEAWTRSVNTGTDYEIEARLVRAQDGAERWWSLRGLPVRNASGTILHWLGVSIDIHDRKTTIDKLTLSEERYRVLADLNPSAMWMASAEGQIIYANQRLLDSTGLPFAQLAGSEWLACIHPDDAQQHVDAWTKSIQSGEVFDHESRTRIAQSGAYRWWQVRALPVRDEKGTILHWLGVSLDVHDARVHAEELRQKQLATERQRAELEAIYQTAPIGLALFDASEFRWLRLNERQAEILGVRREQLLGTRLLDLFPLPGLREMFEKVAAGATIRDQTLEGELPTSPGVRRIWAVNYSPVLGSDGTVQAISSATLEITTQKRAEAALIQNEKLAAVGRLASSISHEINNPLEAVTNILYLVAMSPELHQDLKGYVQLAQSELSRVSQIATQTLRFHRQAVRPTPVSGAELVTAVLNLYQGRLANSGIRVDAVYASGTRVLCFENDIRQVLNNLISNAIDAMRGGGRLIVRAHDGCDYATGRKGVRIAIADTGLGMSPATMARAFEPFFTTKDLNGTGLGLWISADIVHRHKGRLRVRSTDAPARHGTVFTLFLPDTTFVPEAPRTPFLS